MILHIALNVLKDMEFEHLGSGYSPSALGTLSPDLNLTNFIFSMAMACRSAMACVPSMIWGNPD